MKSRIALFSLAAALAASPSALLGAESAVVESAPPADRRPVFVGVEIIPVDAPTRALFKLPETGGLLVIGVAPGSPAEGRLGQGDILVKLGDQLLVNRDQLRSLLRPKRAGDEVTFEIARGGRTESVAVKLAPARVLSAEESGLAPMRGPRDLLRRLNERTRGLLGDSGLDDDAFAEAFGNSTVIGAEGGPGDAATPGFHITTSRSVTLPEGSVTVTTRDGKKSVLVKDAAGKTLAEGELTDALRAKLPAWAKPAIDGAHAPAPVSLRPKTPVAGALGAARSPAA